MSLSRIRDRIGVIEIGLKSAQSAGGLILGMGWMIATFPTSGMNDEDTDRF